MFRKLYGIVGGLIVCFTLLFVWVAPSAQSQSNIARVTITGIVAEDRPGEHPLITTYVSVLDNEGQHVPGLGAREFKVWEFTEEVSGISVSPERQGVAVDLLVDVSGSMEGRGMSGGDKLDDVQDATGRFMEGLRAEDMAGIFTFCKEVEQVQPLTSARAGVGMGIEFEVPTDPALQYTCLYDAMWEAIEDLTGGEEERGDEFARMKKAIFVFSDGLDSGLSACRYELTDVKKLLIARDPKGKISVYAVGVGPEEGDNFRDLMNLADITEGEFFHYFGEREDAQRDLNGAFDRSLTQGEQYVIRYGTEACADKVTLRVEAGGRADEEEIQIWPAPPVIRLSGVEPGQATGTLELKPEFVLEQCPIREVTYYVNGEKMATMAPPFEWEWDTSTLPELGADPSDEGLIEGISVRAEAVDQKGLMGSDEVSGIVVEIPHPQVEIVEPSSGVFIERWVGWRTGCEDAEPVELPVKINVTHSNRERQIKEVRYRLDDQEDSFQQLPAQYALDISSVGCEAIDTETEQILTVEVTDDIGLSGKAEIPLTVSVHIETFWEAVGRFFRNQAGLIPAWLALVLVIVLGVYVLVVGPRQAVETVTTGVRKVTEFLGIATKGTRLVLIEDGKDGRPYALYDVTNLGRDETKVDVAFDHSRVSRLHATLVNEDDVFVLYDQGSKNGTWVNEQRLPFKGQRVLANGDIIDLGQGGVRLRFEMEGGNGNGKEGPN